MTIFQVLFSRLLSTPRLFIYFILQLIHFDFVDSFLVLLSFVFLFFLTYIPLLPFFYIILQSLLFFFFFLCVCTHLILIIKLYFPEVNITSIIRRSLKISRVVYVTYKPYSPNVVKNYLDLCSSNRSTVPPFRLTKIIPIDLYPQTTIIIFIFMFKREPLRNI